MNEPEDAHPTFQIDQPAAGLQPQHAHVQQNWSASGKAIWREDWSRGALPRRRRPLSVRQMDLHVAPEGALLKHDARPVAPGAPEERRAGALHGRAVDDIPEPVVGRAPGRGDASASDRLQRQRVKSASARARIARMRARFMLARKLADRLTLMTERVIQTLAAADADGVSEEPSRRAARASLEGRTDVRSLHAEYLGPGKRVAGVSLATGVGSREGKGHVQSPRRLRSSCSRSIA